MCLEVEAGQACKDCVEDDSVVFLARDFGGILAVLVAFMSLFLGTVIMPTAFALAFFHVFLLNGLNRFAFWVDIML